MSLYILHILIFFGPCPGVWAGFPKIWRMSSFAHWNPSITTSS